MSKRGNIMKVSCVKIALSAFFLCCLSPALASQDLAQIQQQEFSYMLTTLLLLLASALVMFMAAGFCMLESGLVRSKSVSIICLKNVAIYALACLCYYLVGYNLMFEDVGTWIGTFKFLVYLKPEELQFLGGLKETGTVDLLKGGGYFSLAGVLFQSVFVATTASVISGALAERVKLWSFLIFVAILASVIYPTVGAWTWGNGWLGQLGFKDFAGSTIVHSLGGWASLTGAIFLGARTGKFKKNGVVTPTPPSNVPLVTLGVFVLWFGWLGFNGGSVLSYSSGLDAVNMGIVFFNTNLAAAAGIFSTIAFCFFYYKKMKIMTVLNGALAGLVSITAGPDIANPGLAVLIGAIGGLLATLSIPLLEKFKIDDVVGAIPVHLVGGIWGTLAVGIFTKASFQTQLIGVLSIGAFVFITSALLWWILERLFGIRISEDEEFLGQDLVELGVEAYPEFLNLDNMQDK